MTTGIVMSATVAGIGWIAVLANERYLRKQEHKGGQARRVGLT